MDPNLAQSNGPVTSDQGAINGAELKRELTFGEKAVGISFNPGGSSEVNNIKRACAMTIDILHAQMQKAIADNDGEKIAMYKLAIRDIQTGQMWGVKAATWGF